MKHLARIIGIAVLFSLFGTAAPAFAQDEHQDQAKPKQDEQQKQKEPQAKPKQQEQKEKEPQAKTEQHAQPKQEAQSAKSSEHAQPQQNQRASNNGGGRIPDDRFRAHFGREHHFQINRPTMVGGQSRFQYGGYWFGFGQPRPVGWQYTDEVYVDYINGGYYLLSPVHPGVQISIIIVI